ncbi:MAG: hypothetical protein GXP27_00800 [Planctomycetes bacterium]|nr:hypothetical protein [Planctomycetota bacterium]
MNRKLWDDPRIAHLAAVLDVPRPAIIGAVWRVWWLRDEYGVEDVIPQATPCALDILVEVPGFTNEMIAVGLLTKTEDGIRVELWD